MAPTPRKPGPESTLADVKTQLVEAAIGLLRERGVDVELRHVPLSDAIAAASVSRSTAYRSLADDEVTPQAVLHRELLLYLLTRYDRQATVQAISEAIGEVLDRHGDNSDSDDPAARTAVLRAVIRVGANLSYDEVAAAPERAILTAIYAALRSSGTNDWRHAALVEGERGLTDMFAAFYTGLATRFGYEIRPPFTLEQFATAGASLVEGMAIRHGISPHVAAIERPTGIGGEPEEWTMFASAFEALFIGFFRQIDPRRPVTDLQRY